MRRQPALDLLEAIEPDEARVLAYLRAGEVDPICYFPEMGLNFTVEVIEDGRQFTARCSLPQQFGWTIERTMAALDRLCDRGFYHRVEPNQYVEDGKVIEEPLPYFLTIRDGKDIDAEP
jgi:hypothetical protein